MSPWLIYLPLADQNLSIAHDDAAATSAERTAGRAGSCLNIITQSS